jgi:hypothetical protein
MGRCFNRLKSNSFYWGATRGLQGGIELWLRSFWLEPFSAWEIERRAGGARSPKHQNPQAIYPRNNKGARSHDQGAFEKYGVDDGNRTHDNWNHNPALYQLSYAHHIAVLQCCDTTLQKHGADEETRTLTACAAGT